MNSGRPLAALLLTAALPLCAQTAPTAGTQPVAVPASRIEIIGQPANDTRLDDTMARISITREEITRFGDKSVADVLRRLPGVTVTLSPSGATDIRLRGLGAGYTQYLLNGSPFPAGVTVESIPVETIERIEVLRSTSAEAGAQGISGSINIVTRQRVATGSRALVKVHAGRTDGGPTVGATLQATHALEKRQLGVTLTAERTDTEPAARLLEEERDAPGTPVARRVGARAYNYRFETVNLTPRARWAFNAKTSVTLDGLLAYNLLTGGQLERIQASLGENLQYPLTDLTLRAKTSSAHANAELEHTLDSGNRLSARVGLSSVERTSNAAMDGVDEKFNLALQRTVYSPARDAMLTSTGKYTHAVGEAVAVSTGWDLALAKRTERRLQIDDVVQTGAVETTDEAYVSRTHRVATYIQGEWAASKSVDTYGGIRWEGLETESKGDLVRPVSSRSSVLSPVVQSVFRIGGQSRQVRLALARTYKAPALSDLMPRRLVAKNNSAVTPNYQGNPNLQPELAWALDVALEMSEPKSWQASTALYYRRIENVIRLELFEVGGAWVNRPFNGGKADVWGLEVDGKAPVSALSGTTLRANLTWNDSRLHDLPGPYNRINGQVPVSGNIGLDVLPPDKTWGAGLNFGSQRGRRYQVSEPLLYTTGNASSVSAYVLWKIAGSTVRGSASRSEVQSEDRLHLDNLGSLRQYVSNNDTWVFRVQLELPL